MFGLVSKRDIPTNVDLLNECFRLLHPNGYLMTHIEHSKQTKTINNFKMCGFSTSNALDSNSSFLVKNKDHEIKRHGSLWICREPSFDISYSVPFGRTDVCSIKQISLSGREERTWIFEDDAGGDHHDFIDTGNSLDESDLKKSGVKSMSNV